MGRDNFDKKRVVDFATEFNGGEAPPPFYTFSFLVLNIGSHVAAYSPFGALCRRHGMIDSPDSRDGCVSSYSHHLSSVVSSAQEFKPPSVFSSSLQTMITPERGLYLNPLIPNALSALGGRFLFRCLA